MGVAVFDDEDVGGIEVGEKGGKGGRAFGVVNAGVESAGGADLTGFGCGLGDGEGMVMDGNVEEEIKKDGCNHAKDEVDGGDDDAGEGESVAGVAGWIVVGIAEGDEGADVANNGHDWAEADEGED